MTLVFILRVVGTESSVDWHRAVGLTFAANTSFVAIAQLGGRGSSPKNTADLSRSAGDEQPALEKRNHVMGTIACLRNNFLKLDIRGKPVQTLDYWTANNQRSDGNNQQLMGEIVAAQNKLVRPGAVAPYRNESQ